MAWNDSQSEGTCIDHEEWNNMVSFITEAHDSGNRVKDLFDHELYIASSTAITRFADSSATGPTNSWFSASSSKLSDFTREPLTFNVANTRISANQNINVARFTVPSTKTLYVIGAAACASGGLGISGLRIQCLSGQGYGANYTPHNVYWTSSQIKQDGVLAQRNGEFNCEVRFMYSGGGTGVTGIKYGTGFMQIGVF